MIAALQEHKAVVAVAEDLFFVMLRAGDLGADVALFSQRFGAPTTVVHMLHFL